MRVDEEISLNTSGVSIQVYRDPEMAAADVTVTTVDEVAVMVNGRFVTRAQNQSHGDAVQFWDMRMEEEDPLDATALVWRFPDGTVSANINGNMKPAEARRVASRILQASGVPVPLITYFMAGLAEGTGQS